VVVVLLVAWNYYTTGTLSILPSGGSSPVDGQIRGLERDLDAARAQYLQAGRGAGMTGMDTTGDGEAARHQAAGGERGIATRGRSGGLKPAETERPDRPDPRPTALQAGEGGEAS